MGANELLGEGGRVGSSCEAGGVYRVGRYVQYIQHTVLEYVPAAVFDGSN